MLLNSRKKLLSAFIAAMMLFTLIVPTAISLAGTSRTNGKPFAGSNSFAAEQSGGTVVNSSDDEQWIYLKKGETFESSFDDGFTFTADSDVWINAETGAQSEQVNFADLMNFEPDKVETVYDENGNLQRISIVPVNSCTNIKTYANLKYINKLYLKDQFLMIRDSDGKNPKYLKKQLCSYYSKRSSEDVGNLPRVEPKNVLILKYYSFENYFLDPKVMAKIGVIKNEEEFYNILYKKFKDYLFKLNSVKRMQRTLNIRIRSKQDIKDNIESIKIYVRGHNLFDIFYGRYHGSDEQAILKKYIDAAPRETFQDIFDAIDSFVYFENRRK